MFVLLEINDFVILIDTSPDLREQLLDANVKRVADARYSIPWPRGSYTRIR